jgi:DNA-binding transcriptional ArsR family regulator
MKEAVAALSALAQESRLEVFRLLVRQGPGGLPAGGVAERLGMPAATLSFHLSQLRHAGLVRSRRVGRQIVYAADYARMGALLAYLTENCCRPEEGAALSLSCGDKTASPPRPRRARTGRS